MMPSAAMPPPGHGHTIEAVRACGVDASNVKISYDEELQSDVLTVGKAAQASGARLSCILRSVHPFYFVRFEDGRTDSAYQKLATEEAGRRATLEGRKWLQSRGLLQGMPRYRPGEARLGKFVRDVEAHCSVKPGSAIEILTPTSVTLRIGFMRSVLNSGGRRRGDRLTCLINVLAASDLAQGGVSFGFVGNESTATGSDER